MLYIHVVIQTHYLGKLPRTTTEKILNRRLFLPLFLITKTVFEFHKEQTEIPLSERQVEH